MPTLRSSTLVIHGFKASTSSRHTHYASFPSYSDHGRSSELNCTQEHATPSMTRHELQPLIYRQDFLTDPDCAHLRCPPPHFAKGPVPHFELLAGKQRLA
jgi:hypothetical protein